MMDNEIVKINNEIRHLTIKQKKELIDLKTQFDFTLATLSPANFIKSTLQDAIALPDLQNNLVDNAIGMATGYLSKKVLIGSTNNPIKKLLGSIFQLVVTSYVSKHSDSIKQASEVLINKVFPKRDY